MARKITTKQGIVGFFPHSDRRYADQDSVTIKLAAESRTRAVKLAQEDSPHLLPFLRGPGLNEGPRVTGTGHVQIRVADIESDIRI